MTHTFLTTGVQRQIKMNLVDDRGRVKGRMNEDTVKERVATDAKRDVDTISFEVTDELMIVRLK